MEARFDYLKNHPDLIEVCARWSFEEWGHHVPDRTLEDFVRSREAYAQHDNQLLLTIVAFVDTVPVGMCSLAQTRGILPELSPWLAALFVVPSYRKRGIGGLLEGEICRIAVKLAFDSIYCFTSDQLVISWYEKHGWSVRETSWIHDHEVTVLEKKL